MISKVHLAHREIASGSSTFIIAEAGSNHDGKLEQAHRLIDVAADAGADAIKFQLFRVAHLYPPNVGMVETPVGKIDFYSFLEQAALQLEWLASLKQHAEGRGLVFIVSAFDEASVDALDRVGIVIHKIASPELTHLPLIRHMARTGKPLILSTGMSRLGDIEEALDVAKGVPIVLLHCVSSYPLALEECNLNVIPTLQSAFRLPVGFSDHTMDAVKAPCATVALGGCVVEKHFTLDRNLPGPDHPFALEPHDLQRMVNEIRALEQSDALQHAAFLQREDILPLLGSSIKEPAPSECEMATCDRRMILILRDIKQGDVISSESVRILRAERNVSPGLFPKYWEMVIGARAMRDVHAGRGLVWEDIISK